MEHDPLQAAILSIRQALLRLDGRSLLAELADIADLPMAGIAAGQSVATLAMRRLGIMHDGPMNDVDVFMSPHACARAHDLAALALPSATERLSALSSRVGSSSFAPWESRYSVMMDIIVKDGYSVLATARSDMLNEIVYSRFGSRFQPLPSLGPPAEESLSVIRAFDLDCAQIGVDIRTGSVHWTPAFERFLATFELHVITVATPHHTATRYFKKKNALGCQGDDELAMGTCALPGLLGFHEDISKIDPEMAQSVMVYGAKAHADYDEVIDQISPWFKEIREPTRSPLWRLAPVMPSHRRLASALSSPTHAGGSHPPDALSQLARNGIWTRSPALILPRAAAFAARALRGPSPAVSSLRDALAHGLSSSGCADLTIKTAATLMAIMPEPLAAGRSPTSEEALASIRMIDKRAFLMHAIGDMSLASQGEACLRAESLACSHGDKAWLWLASICEEGYAPRLFANPEALEAFASEMAARPDWTAERSQFDAGRAMAAEVAHALLHSIEQQQAIEAELGPIKLGAAAPRRAHRSI